VISLAQFGQEMRRFAQPHSRDGVARLVAEAQRAIARAIEDSARPRTPVDTGLAQRSVAAKARSGKGGAKVSLSALSPGMEAVVGGSPVFNLLEGGRRQGKRGPIGSLQAPGGVFGPAIDAANLADAIERAVERLERRV